MYVCMYIYIYIYIYMYVCMYVYMYICVVCTSSYLNAFHYAYSDTINHSVKYESKADSQ